MVCSMDELALRRVAEASDRLEIGHRAGGLGGQQSACSSDLEARIAEIWAMVREIDPQMSRLAARYADPSS